MRSRYVAARLVSGAVTVFVAITINFVLFRIVPGDAVAKLSRVPNASAALRASLHEEFGLDRPMLEQYGRYVVQLAQGNMGVSFADREPVVTNLRAALINTVPMVLVGTSAAIVLGLVFGTIAAWRKDTLLDHVGTGIAVICYSLPSQWVGLMLIMLFAGTLPTGGMRDDFLIAASPVERWLDVARHMILPAATLALALFGQFALIVRTSTIEALREDHVLTARAKGLHPTRVLVAYGLRNSLLPIVTLIALSLGYVVAGSILVETVFSWPGIGRTVYESVLNRDYPMLQGAFLLLTLSVVFFNIVADILYAYLDPRVAS